MTTSKLLATAGILIALVSLSFLPAAAQSYTVTDLGTLGGPYSGALALNDVGQVVGFADLSNGQSRGFIWSSVSGMQDIGGFNGFGSFPRGINNSGQVVGDSDGNAFLWTAAGGMQDLGSLGGQGATAYAINNLGQVVGQAVLSDNVTSHAFLWTATGGMQDLGTLQNSGYSWATAINDAGHIVGFSTLSDNVTVHAFLWTQASGMQDLGTLGGVTSGAYGINSLGQIVGVTSTPTAAVDFIWDKRHGMQLLNLGNSVPLGINSAGEVTGYFFKTGNERGFIWTKALGIQNLNALMSHVDGLCDVAYAINTLGQIAGSSNKGHALLLTPTK